MKLKLKVLASAAALASLAGGAQADITNPGSGNGSLVLVAFDTVTRDWYMRDLGFVFSTFLPSQVTLLSGEGGTQGTRTPEAGLTLNAGNTPTFADASFGGWLATHTAANIRWFVSAVDDAGSTATNFRRLISSSANAGETATNGQIDGYVASGAAGGLSSLFNPGGLSRTGTGDSPAGFDNNFGLGADSLSVLDQTVNLFYFGRTVGAGSTTALANGGAFRNSANIATLTFESDGDLVYSLLPAEVNPIPLPAAAWMLGAGLLAIGGFVRRRTQGQAA